MGSDTFYYLNEGGELYGGVITHVDNFNLAGAPDFVKDVISVVAEELNVSKVKEDIFHFIGLDLKVVKDGITISMEDYSSS